LSVGGWLSPAEGAHLQQLARGLDVLEIGVWKGRSTACLAETARHVVSIDHFRGDEFTGPANTMRGAWETICRLELRGRVTLIATDFRKALELLPLERFGFAYYDADHTYEATAAALRLLAGIPRIAVHDYDAAPNRAGVVQAVDQFASQTGRPLLVTGRLAVLGRPPATLIDSRIGAPVS